MEDHFSDSSPLALSRLIEAGEVSHSLTCDPTRIVNETELLQALCGAISGQIYRLGPLSYVFEILGDDLGGSLRDQPSKLWGEIVANRLRADTALAPDDSAIRVEPLAPAILPVAPQDDESGDEWSRTAALDEAPEAAHDLAQAPVETAPDADELVDAAAAAAAPACVPCPQEGDEGDAVAAETNGAAESGFADRIYGIEQGIARIEGLIATLAPHEGAQAESFAALGSRLDRVEHQIGAGLSDLKERLAPFGPCLDAIAAEQVSDRGRVEELAEVIARLPERSAAAMAARSESLTPVSVALNDVLRRLEERADALLERLVRCDGGSSPASEDEENQAAMTEFLARVEHVLASDTGDSTSGRVRNIRGL